MRFASAFPTCHAKIFFWRFHFLLGTIYYTASGPHRIKALSQGRCDPSDPVATTQHLVPFLAAGFRAPARTEDHTFTTWSKAQRKDARKG